MSYVSNLVDGFLAQMLADATSADELVADWLYVVSRSRIALLPSQRAEGERLIRAAAEAAGLAGGSRLAGRSAPNTDAKRPDRGRPPNELVLATRARLLEAHLSHGDPAVAKA